MNGRLNNSDHDFGRLFLASLDQSRNCTFPYAVRQSLRHADREGVLGILSAHGQGVLYSTIQVIRSGSPEELAAEWERLMKGQQRAMLVACLILSGMLLLH